MNKVQHINLSGVPFTIDEDAFVHLNRYLESIHAHFQASEGYEEITHDIEARMAELFQEGLGQRRIVTLQDVRDAIVIMGTPEDFGAEPIGEGSSQAEAGEGSTNYRTGRRLFRDEDEEVIGGVCAGIAAYFGINDPLWVRLIFIVVTLSGGFGIPAYLILWAIVPSAKTAGDRLAMKGEPINASNIGKIIEEEIEHISAKVSELGGKKKGQQVSDEIGNALRQLVILIGKAMKVVIQLLRQIWKPILLLIGAALLLAFLVSWVGVVSGSIFAWPYLGYFLPDWPLLSMVAVFNLLIMVSMVLLSIALSILRLLYGTRISGAWRAGLTVFSILNVVCFFVIGTFVAREFSNEAKVPRRTELSELTSDTLALKFNRDFEGEAQFKIDNDVVFLDKAMLVRNVVVEIRKGESFSLTEELQSRGSNLVSAEDLALSLEYPSKMDGNVLELPIYLRVPEGSKWRAPRVKVKIELPVGGHIRFEDGPRSVISQADKASPRPRIYDHPGSTWQMTEEGLLCLDCD